MQLNPYLLINGQCEAAFRFYERCLGGKIVAMMPHAGTPAEGQVPPEWRDKIIHARLVVGDQVLMGSDAPPAILKNRKASRSPSALTIPSKLNVFSMRWQKTARCACRSSRHSGPSVLGCLSIALVFRG
jgi:uncharacterized glyoxalase superfamily protein PhnB